MVKVEDIYEIPVQGTIEYSAAYDWFETNCKVTYLPGNVTTGQLVLYYKFR